MSPSPNQSATHTVELGEGGFKVDGEARKLIAADFEYFRHERGHWERILDTIEGAGIEIVSTFIAWDFHELEPGRFDLTGETHPSRDLAAFLELCQARGLLVLARPGPFIDAEWETRGPAGDVAQLDRLHPRFLERAAEWVEAVSQVLVPAQLTRGGPVAAVGLDNQIIYPWSTSEALYRTDGDIRLPYDAEYHDGIFRSWLRDQHGTVESLNAEHGTRFAGWDEVRAPKFADDPHSYSQAGIAFVTHHIQEYLRRLRGMFTEAGIDVPTYTNQFQFLGHVDWTAVEVDSVGLDLFMPDKMPGDQALAANWWYRLHFARFDYRWAAEFQAGWIGLFEKYGFLSPEHGEYMPMAAQAAGLRGMSLFIFAEREDWAHSPVNAHGKIRPERYERITRAVRSYRELDDLDTQLADVGLLWGLHDHAMTYITAEPDWSALYEHCDNPDEAKEPGTWWAAFRQLLEADVDFRLWIPGVSPGTAPAVLVHAGLPHAPKEHVSEIAALVADGSRTLIELTELPRRDLRGLRATELEDAYRATRDAAVPSTGRDLEAVVAQCGATAYARASQRGVWSYVFRDRDGRTVLGLWNPLDEPFDGHVRLASAALPGDAERYVVEEPRLGTRVTRERADVACFEAGLDAHSARVFRIAPEGGARP